MGSKGKKVLVGAVAAGAVLAGAGAGIGAGSAAASPFHPGYHPGHHSPVPQWQWGPEAPLPPLAPRAPRAPRPPSTHGSSTGSVVHHIWLPLFS